ncbi:MAG: hypothetical protein ACRDOH_24560, partial [Streptosporangiaceae bacterium]
TGAGQGRAGLLSVEPATVTVSALKPHGNPLASGRTKALTDAPAEHGAVTVRLRETSGRPTTARVRLGSGGPEAGVPGVLAAWLTDLLEESDGAPLPVENPGLPVENPGLPVENSGGGAVVVDMPAFGTVTVVLRTTSRGPAGTAGTAGTDLAQPVYARYWLHGKGPAPAGNLPVAVHFSPARVALTEPGDAATLTLTVGCGAEPASGVVELVSPAEVAVALNPLNPLNPLDPLNPLRQDLRYQLAAGGYAAWDLTVRVPPGTAAGRYFVAARIRDELGYLIEDTAMVAVGERRWPDPDLPPEETLGLLQADYNAGAAEIDLDVLTPELRLVPGGEGELLVRVTSGLASELHGEAQLVSPFGAWEVLGPWTQGFSLAPGTSTVLRFAANVPATIRHAQWWALVKLMYYGRVRYTEAIPVVIEHVN